jgi:hypothetical protein
MLLLVTGEVKTCKPPPSITRAGGCHHDVIGKTSTTYKSVIKRRATRRVFKRAIRRLMKRERLHGKGIGERSFGSSTIHLSHLAFHGVPENAMSRAGSVAYAFSKTADHCPPGACVLL